MSEPCSKCGEYHNNCFELKNLTDEEIIDVVESVFGTFYSMMACNNSWVDFARAILRKAQEK